ncbi:MAG: hypothetical protein JNJ55_09790 [Betaproteobacteria bacterium]|nr:hypothetical protein [Betaproteobacteria bacterium]
MLTDDLRATLDSRLEIIDAEQSSDPAFQELPSADRFWLLVLLIVSCLAVPLWQLWRVS